MDRITAIQKSLTGFVCGIFSFVPVLGLIPGVHAVSCWRVVRRRYREQWNPAGNYLTAGAVLGLLGILSSVILVGAAAVFIISQYWL